MSGDIKTAIDGEEKQTVDYKANSDYWSNRWDENKTGWHRSSVNPTLINNLEKLTSGDKTKKIFIPLCGKSLDIVYLLNEGFTNIFAVEVVKKAIIELDTEHSLGLVHNEQESTFQTPDGRLTIYNGDLFQCNFELFGPFDCIWDRGSFIALEYPFRDEYVKAMQRSVSRSGTVAGDNTNEYHDFRYLMETVDYDKQRYPGPPRAVNYEDMEKYYGGWTNIEILSTELESDSRVAKIPDIGTVNQIVYLLTPKIK